ncbi:MAG: WG repeat-containing protein [Verrucomicrobiia bacterium]|jgi:hypothetical protein
MKNSSSVPQPVTRRRALAVLAAAPVSIALAAAAQPVQNAPTAQRPVREPLVAFRQFDRFGYKDQNGTVIHKPIFDGAGSFFDPLGRPRQIAWVRIGKKFGYLDRQGKYAVRPSFDTIHEFSEGFAGFRQRGLYGYIDEAGRIAIKAQFKSIEPFSTGIAAVRLGDLIGWIDRTGQFFDRRPGDDAAR